jgi:hypothetical protein
MMRTMRRVAPCDQSHSTFLNVYMIVHNLLRTLVVSTRLLVHDVLFADLVVSSDISYSHSFCHFSVGENVFYLFD